MTGDLQRYQGELEQEPALVRHILAVLSAQREEPGRIIRCSRDRANEAVARAIILARDRREVWKVEIVEERGK